MSELARVMSAVNNSAPVTTWKKKALILPGAILRRPGRRCKRFRRQSALRQDISLQWHRVGQLPIWQKWLRRRWFKMPWRQEGFILSEGLLCFAAALRSGEAVTWYASEKKLADDYARYRGMDSHEADGQPTSAKPFDAGRTINEVTPREFAIRALQQAGYKDKSAIDLIKGFQIILVKEK